MRAGRTHTKLIINPLWLSIPPIAGKLIGNMSELNCFCRHVSISTNLNWNNNHSHKIRNGSPNNESRRSCRHQLGS